MRNLILVVMLFILGNANALTPLDNLLVNGTVYNDLNGDGKLQEGEPGIQYVRINVVDENDTVIAYTSTNENGTFRVQVYCRHGIDLWAVPEVPEGMENTRDPRYEFSCYSGFTVITLFGFREIPCTNPDDCNYNETCSGGTCVPLFCAGLEGYIIENHKCIAIPECTEDADCGFDEICSDGKCVRITCPEGYKIENHSCVYVPPEEPEEEEIPEEVPEENVTEEIPEEEKPPEENVTIEVPEEEKPTVSEEPVEEEGIPAIVLVALIIAAAAVVITYTVVGKKQT